jgi:hypothetical protein
MAKMTLDDLVAQLSLVYGGELQAVVLYGSAARGDRLAKRSNLNVLVLVQQVTMAHLRKESAVAAAWREAGNPPPLTLTMDEWRGSSDIFPMEYADIIAHHRVLHGTLPIEGIDVVPANLRLQLEHETMGKLLRLRHAILSAGTDERAQREVLEESVSSMMVLVRSAARLSGMDPPADSEALLAEFERRSGVPLGELTRVVRYSRGSVKIERGALEATLEGYLGAVQALVRYLDRFEGA